jgi:hypothetical protein
MANNQIVNAGIKSFSLIRYINFGFLLIFLIYILIHGVLIGINNHDITLTVKELGDEFLSPIEKAQDISLRIVNEENSLFDYWGFYSSIYIIYLWIKLLGKIVGYSPFSNDSNKFINVSLGIIFFIVIQIVYLAISGKNINVVWQVWIDIFRAINFKITGVKPNISNVVGDLNLSETCSGDICRVKY